MSNHKHYKREITVGDSKITVDLYFMLRLFGVTDQAVGHAVKKLMFAGQRGAKSYTQDLNEARATIERALDLEAELPQLLLDLPLPCPLPSDEYIQGAYVGVALNPMEDSPRIDPNTLGSGTVTARYPSGAYQQDLFADDGEDDLFQLAEDLITSVDQTIKEADEFREQLPPALRVVQDDFLG